MWIFFDLDGTLIDNLDLHFALFSKFIRTRGIRPTRALFTECNGPSLLEIMQIVRRRGKLPESAETLVRAYLEQLPRAYGRTAKIRAGATAVLKKCKRDGHRLMLVTSAPRDVVMPFLQRKKWHDVFDALTFADEVRHGKPHPAIYRAAQKKSRAARAHIVVVEDSANGVAAAKSAGLPTIGIGQSHQKNRAITQSDWAITDLRELFSIVTTLTRS